MHLEIILSVILVITLPLEPRASGISTAKDEILRNIKEDVQEPKAVCYSRRLYDHGDMHESILYEMFFQVGYIPNCNAFSF